MLLKKIINEVMLYEGLEITHSIDASLNNLLRMWNFDGRVMYEEADGTLKMSVYKPIDQKQLDTVLKHIENLLGYFPSYIVTSKSSFKYDYNKLLELLNHGDYFGIYFDAKYDQEIPDKLLPDLLYHISPSIYENKILKVGLLPKKKDKLSSHPSRIYLTFMQEAAIGLLSNDPFTKDIDQFTLFSIDCKKLKSERKIVFLKDPTYLKKGIYTHENIPATYLKVVKHITRS